MNNEKEKNERLPQEDKNKQELGANGNEDKEYVQQFNEGKKLTDEESRDSNSGANTASSGPEESTKNSERTEDDSSK